MSIQFIPKTAAHGDLIWTVASGLSGSAAALHLACLVGGGPMYRFLGAGKRMAELADAGNWYPSLMTIAIAGILATWTWYAAAAADILVRPPLLRIGLCLITAFYLLRGLALLPLLVRFAGGERSFLIAGAGGGVFFWIITSLICLIFGLVHLAGLITTWRIL